MYEYTLPGQTGRSYLFAEPEHLSQQNHIEDERSNGSKNKGKLVAEELLIELERTQKDGHAIEDIGTQHQHKHQRSHALGGFAAFVLQQLRDSEWFREVPRGSERFREASRQRSGGNRKKTKEQRLIAKKQTEKDDGDAYREEK